MIRIHRTYKGVMTKARLAINTPNPVRKAAHIATFNLVLNEFNTGIRATASAFPMGRVNLEYYLTAYPNPVIQYLFRLAIGGIAVEDSRYIFEELMISNIDNADDPMIEQNAANVILNAYSITDSIPPNGPVALE